MEVLRQFQIALALRDEPSIRRLALPDPDLDVLWQGDKPDIEQLNSIYLTFGAMKIGRLKAGDSFRFGGHDVDVTEQMANDHVALVRRQIPGREEAPLAIRKVKGRWRLDARPFIHVFLQQAGRSPRPFSPDAWDQLANLDRFLATSPRLWDARLVDLEHSPQGKSFQVQPGKQARASCQPKSGDSSPALFGDPVQRLDLRFDDGLLAALTATLYDAKATTKTLTAGETQKRLAQLDQALCRLTGTQGRFRRQRRDPADRTHTVRAKEWEAMGMLLRMEAVVGRMTVTDPRTRRTSNRDGVVAIRVLASELPEDPGNALVGDRSLSQPVRQALATLGTRVSPASAAFWQQTKTTFLGTFVEAKHAHWTQEQERDGVANFRCTYIQKPHNEMRNAKPVCFISNEPLSGSGLVLFGKPVVAMLATFHQDCLVEFRFDFWNKGDASVKSAYNQTDGLAEKTGEDSFDQTLALLRKAGLEFHRRSGSMGTVSHVRETHFVADAGPTRVTFIRQKDEYYSLLLQSSRFLREQENRPQERITTREVRKDAKDRVIRIGSEEDAAKHPGVVRVGDVFLEVPMVDQGPKGYCAPATLMRVVEYYGHETTMNEMAAMMETQGGEGTLLRDVKEGVCKVTRRLRMSFREEEVPDKGRLRNDRRLDRWVGKAVIEYIDNGNPIFWTVPEHQRLIVGYNAKTREILYSDSWGRRGYDRISYREAAEATEGIWIVR